MKRFVVVLALLAVFAGCGAEIPESSAPASETTMTVSETSTVVYEINTYAPISTTTYAPPYYHGYAMQTNSASSMIWPLPSTGLVTVAIGAGCNSSRSGIDITNDDILGKIVVAVAEGRVIYAGIDPDDLAYGEQVRIEHNNGYITRYAHLMTDSVAIKEGDTVGLGQPIARVGSTGNTADPRLHFEVIDLATGNQLNPLDFVMVSYD